MNRMRCVLLDIEGTVCPISFVKDTLFPYALKALPEVLVSKWDSDDFQSYRKSFPENARASREVFEEHVQDLTKRDVKVAYLKDLQGFLWENGYKTGAYSTPLFPDVAPQLTHWKDNGVQLAIYSSGSVFAQKLLFGHVDSGDGSSKQKRKRSDELVDDAPPEKKPEVSGHDAIQAVAKSKTTMHDGSMDSDSKGNSVGRASQVTNGTAATEDLQHLITAWYDTVNAGSKQESSSYKKIADALGISPADILFLSDNVKEVDAAIEAGMDSVVVDRPGNAPLSDAEKDRLRVVNTLDEISLPKETKKGTSGSPQSEKKTRRQSSRLKAKEA